MLTWVLRLCWSEKQKTTVFLFIKRKDFSKLISQVNGMNEITQ